MGTPLPVPPAAEAASATGSPSRTVTLITGERVTVTGTAVTRVEATAGVRVSTFHGETYAYPDAALPYVASGLLDADLFNVTRLIADGYDDAHADRLPLIVEYAPGARTLPKSAADVRPLDSIGGAAITVARSREFWSTIAAPGTSMRGGVSRIWLDGKVRAALADSTAQIGAPKVWAGGDTGAGVDVAVLDTGVDREHPDLVGRIEEVTSFVPGEEVTDRHGHGTHVASTIAGTGAASGGAERGVAPGADLHIGKVLNDQGAGQESWAISGMEWAARTAHAKVVNMSLGAAPTDGTDPLSAAVDRLSAETGTLFVIAAGNSGPDLEMVGAPGAAASALTVGAVDAQDRLTVFSSRGPRHGDNAPKPDLTAPGVDILAARSQYAAEGEGAYQTMSGTSMASPHVAGAAALLAAAHPDWTGARLKDALMSTSRRTPQHPLDWAGSGRVDVNAAVHATVLATGTTFAGLRWPYSPGQRAEQTITYTNTASRAVTLDLTVDGAAFTLPRRQVTVPARGTATASVVTPLDPMPDGTYAIGSVTATGPDGISVRTVVGVNREAKHANLTVTSTDPDGKPLGGVLIAKDVLNDTPPRFLEVDASGKLTVRLPASTWAMWMYADVPGANGPHSLGRAVLAAPEVVLDRDREVLLDGRTLVQARAVTPSRSSLAQLRVDLFRSHPGRYPFGDDYVVGPQYDSIWATPTGRKVTQGAFTFGTRWSSTEPMLSLTAAGERFDDLLPQSGSPKLPEGVYRQGAVLIPAGGSFAPARGKVAVVRYVDVPTAIAQADAAHRAGATMLLIVNTGPGRLDAWWEVGDPSTPLPVAAIARDPGERLLSLLGRSTVTVESHPEPRYVYDLNRWHTGAIPADLTWRPRERDLARVEQDFRSRSAGTGYLTRGDAHPDRPGSALLGPIVPIPVQGRRTDWVSSGAWREQAGAPEMMILSDAHSYPIGHTTTTSWFAPIGRPRLFDDGTFPAPARIGELVGVFGIPAFGDGDPHHQGILAGGATQTIALHDGGTELGRADGDILVAEVGTAAKSLRMVVQTAHDGSVTPYSTRTDTEWAFRSPAPDLEHVESVPLDLVQLDYQVATSRSGVASRHARLGVTASRIDGRPLGSATRVEVSYDDGRTWHKLGRSGTLDAPRSARFVSVRATATDAAKHGSVTQTVIRAFGVR
ncbi:S8 family serine peptidase [Micromonospora sp. WMMD710]|uniref:S8 family serine peptidase n=1 Tax=Micromonospora sp. WMMD710 TaxID=3016085 RepID=UPI0024179D36|nr:S8 family serine peptidase [Micromonospora sp. WMMD710]MDG4756661.1 S8 family serine peptidase [Micromonospora sp. WMMD710]